MDDATRNPPPQGALLDFADSDAQAGFRLLRCEIYNWGTFDSQVWTLTPGGANSLLTGDIGSGKSTLVDAITTLLVPHQRITYNKAAGADTRERSLRSYVLGHYRSERGDDELAARAVALRDHNSYSVILGYFYNAGFDHHVTLAQVFWTRNSGGQPERLYVIADRPLTIAQHFADFGTDIGALRKRLRTQEQTEIHDRFPAYGAAFRRRFGIDGEQALELFSQTVSLKSVGNLTDFVRAHMLEPFPVEERIEKLIHHFDDLDRAHQAVVTARQQVEALQPLVADADEHTELAARIDGMRGCRDALRPYFASLKAGLLGERIERLDTELQREDARIHKLEDERTRQHARRDEFKQAIADNGGDRVERLKVEIRRLEDEQTQRQHHAAQYRDLATALELPEPENEAGFRANQEQAQSALDAIEEHRNDLQNRLTDASVTLRGLRSQYDDLQAELTSLRQRRSNLPAAMLGLRQQLCTDLELAEDELPFAGELIQVHEDERDWEGAIERLLHNFGLSLLCPEARYRDVAAWVDRTYLRGRLVYYRVRPSRERALPELHLDSLVRKLAIRPESEHYAWLEQELARRFNYACCDDLDRFRREKQAVTRSGQIKAGGERHEKDDRHRIDDRSRFILGWSNEAKIAALEQQAGDLEHRIQEAAAQVAQLQQDQTRLDGHAGGLHRIQAYTEFAQIDWRPLVKEIERLDAERRSLEAESDTLQTLQRQLDALEEERAATEYALDQAREQRGSAQSKHDTAAEMIEGEQAVLTATPEDVREQLFPQLEALREEILGEHRLTVESCDNRQQDLRQSLQDRIDSEDKRLSRLGERIVDAMRRYQNAWPQETGEVDCSIAAAGEYRAMLERLQADDLPRFEARFRDLLRENTIREVANFNAQLEKERFTIQERIQTINRSLAEIDYNPNRYIHLVAELTPDPEVRDFRQELRACTEGTITGSEDDQYSEAKFLQVQAIIERFRGRDGSSDHDRRWTRKVTDVRSWFVFSASERWREDDSEHEHYSDSGGKSGGQKEKLAYTVLAASLAYQFGLEWGEKRSRSFRFVVIDEAFGRGSDESARYGLELFNRLNLQLLVVTPLQKIHIIEPHVASVGFVHNDGRQSLLRNLSIEEYQAEKAARAQVKVEA